MFTKNYNVCNNCGKSGHVYNNCKIPITSYGVISFKKDDANYKFLMICRKDSLGYVDFIRGKYPLYNKNYIQNLVDEMTNEEKHNIMNHDFDYLWNKLWCSDSGIQYRIEEKSSRNKFEQIKRGIQLNDNEKYDINTIITNSKTNWTTPEWGFPKGRRNYQENDLQCAIREFSEETGFPKNKVSVIKNLIPFDEIFTGSNFKSYKHRYFLANSKHKDESKFQKSEVSKLKWMDLDEAIKYIRPYNLERIDLLKNIDKVLSKYSLIS